MAFDKAEYTKKYAKEKLKRVPLDVTKDKYEEIKAAADSVGETVNGYIKKAVDDRISSGKCCLLPFASIPELYGSRSYIFPIFPSIASCAALCISSLCAAFIRSNQ